MSCALERPMQVAKLVMKHNSTMVPERCKQKRKVNGSNKCCRAMWPEHCASQAHPQQVCVPSILVLSIRGTKLRPIGRKVTGRMAQVRLGPAHMPQELGCWRRLSTTRTAVEDQLFFAGGLHHYLSQWVCIPSSCGQHR